MQLDVLSRQCGSIGILIGHNSVFHRDKIGLFVGSLEEQPLLLEVSGCALIFVIKYEEEQPKHGANQAWRRRYILEESHFPRV